jgi:hypothetical protein
MSDNTTLFIILIIFFTGCIYLLIYHLQFSNKTPTKNHNKHAGTCDTITCGALDPVSDPAYNMQQIVKQSILLEEHITNKNKRCRDCITKHFLHIIGLAEEAQMLATTKCNKYQLLNESVELYNRLFTKWMAVKDDDVVILTISDELRIHRKKLIAIYFFNDTYDLNNFSKSSKG